MRLKQNSKANQLPSGSDLLKEAKVSIIIVTFNSADTIQDALKSVLEQTFKDYEIIILDNASKDNTLGIVTGLLDTWHGDYKIIPSSLNLGFAEGNNKAFEITTGKYIALINPDAVAEVQWLGELVAAMDASSEIGICASKIINSDSHMIDSAGDGFAKSLQGFKRGEGLSPENFCNKEYIFGACACAALYRRTMLDEIGFFDPDFFLIHEDTDLNFRAQLAGWRVMYAPSAIVHHKVRSSIGAMSDLAIYYSMRNKDMLILKNADLGLIIRCLPQIVTGKVGEFIYFVIKHKKYRPYLQAKADTIKNIPNTIKKRSSIKKLKKNHDDYLSSLLVPVWKHDYLLQKMRKLLYG